MRIRAKTFRAWMLANLKDNMRDIAEHGADAGWAGLTYYADTNHLYDHFNREIWDALYEDMEAYGSPNVISLIAGFKCAKDITNDTQFKNALVWYIAERVARKEAGEA